MDITLKKDRYISITLCQGIFDLQDIDTQSIYDVLSIYDILYTQEILWKYLKDYQDNNIPIPLEHFNLPEYLKGSKLSICIDDIIVQQSPDFMNCSIKYEIILKGELV